MAPPLPPFSPLKGAAHRAAMAASALRLLGRRDRVSRALARALWTTALGRIPSPEREWSARIEARRDEIARSAGSGSSQELGVVDLESAVIWMSVPEALGLFLARLVRELEPRSCLEIGTGFGLSGAYQAAALELNRAGKLTTVEVAAPWAAVASEGFAQLGLERVEVRVDERPEGLEAALADAAPVDYAFIDADHREAPTIEYFERMLPYLGPAAVIVFDDVGFSSAEMARAWRAIASHPRVPLALRLARMGIALVRE